MKEKIFVIIFLLGVGGVEAFGTTNYYFVKKENYFYNGSNDSNVFFNSTRIGSESVFHKSDFFDITGYGSLPVWKGVSDSPALPYLRVDYLTSFVSGVGVIGENSDSASLLFMTSNEGDITGVEGIIYNSSEGLIKISSDVEFVKNIIIDGVLLVDDLFLGGNLVFSYDADYNDTIMWTNLLVPNYKKIFFLDRNFWVSGSEKGISVQGNLSVNGTISGKGLVSDLVFSRGAMSGDGYSGMAGVALTSGTGYVMMNNGSVRGLSVSAYASAVTNQGVVVFQVRKNNVNIFNATVNVTGVGAYNTYVRKALGEYTFSAGDYVSLYVDFVDFSGTINPHFAVVEVGYEVE